MPTPWFREYRDAVAPQWLRWGLAGATLVGGLAGGHYLVEKAGMSPLAVALALLVLVLFALNVRQAVVWKRKHVALRKAAAESKCWREQYEVEEQSWWTPGRLSYSSKPLPPNHMDQPHGVQVRVSSPGDPIVSPIRVRLFFNGAVGDSLMVWFLPDRSRYSSADIEGAIASGAGSFQVHPGGRVGQVDVAWASEGDVLNGRSELVLAAYADGPGKAIRLLDVQRRYRVS